ncbi:MAG: leucine-rich repeat protein [Paludibacteraceae bacterium]|nr:leucine-rich repeat protein [Paludibacteraceae bacterium]
MKRLFFFLASAVLTLTGLFFPQCADAQTVATIDGINYVLIDATKQAVVAKQSEKNNNYYAIKDVISIPETVTYDSKTYTVSAIADDAFHYWQYGAFMNVAEVETAAIIIPKTVKAIGDRVFKECGAKDVFFLGETPPTLGEDNHTLLKMRIHVPYGCGANYRGTQIVFHMGAHYWVLPWENYLLPTTKDVTIVEIETQSGYEIILPSAPAKREGIQPEHAGRAPQEGDKDIITILDTEYECVSHLKGTPFEELPYMENGLFFNIRKIDKEERRTLIADPTFRRYENLGETIDCKGMKMDTIGEYAFRDNQVLKEFIGDSYYFAKVISVGAFMNCGNLEAVSGLGAYSLKKIDNFAFFNCPNLRICIFHRRDKGNGFQSSQDLNYIGDYAFGKCGKLLGLGYDANDSRHSAFMKLFSYPKLTFLGEGAFANCNSINGVSFPESLTSIGAHCFHGCKNIERIIVPWIEPLEIDAETFDPVRQDAVLKVPTLTKNDYAKAEGWKNFRIDDSGEREIWNGDLLYRVNVNVRDNYVATVIGINPLFNFEAEEVVIPRDFTMSNGAYVLVDLLGDSAFAGTPVRSVTIPSSVKNIRTHCFENCTQLRKVNYQDDSDITENYIGAYVLDYAFSNTALTEITVNSQIDFFAFRNTPLKTVRTKSHLINGGAFMGCSQLEKVTLEYLMTESHNITIGEQAFADCVNLKEIDVLSDKHVPYINDEGLTSLGVWRDVDLKKIVAHVPSGTKNSYAAAPYWQEMQIVEEPVKIDGLCYILNKNTANATITYETQDENNYAGLEEVTIPAEPLMVNGQGYYVTNVAQGAFAHSPITSIKLPPLLTTIDAEAFKNSMSLKKVEWDCDPSKTYSVGAAAFDGCSALEDIVLPATAAFIGDAAFRGCTALDTLTLPKDIYLGKDAFYGCTGLKDIVTLSTNPQNIAEKGVFADVDQSKVTLHIPSGNQGKYEAADVWKNFAMVEYQTKIGDFYYFLDEAAHTATLTYESTDWDLNYKDLAWDKKYVIPATFDYDDAEYKVTAIADFAFSGNNNDLSDITLPEGIMTIGKQAFSPCMNLASFNIPMSVTSIGQDAFYLTNFVQNDANYFQGLLHKDQCLIAAKDDILKDYAFPEIEKGTRLIAGGALAYCKHGPTKIPASVKYICEGAFENNEALYTLYMTDCPELTTIEQNAFRNCPNLSAVDFSNATQTIGDNAFFGTLVHEILLPKSLDMIGVGAFDNCTKLNWVIIPAVNAIGDYAFRNNTIARNVYVRAESPEQMSIGVSLFEGMNPAKSTLYVPYGCKANYESADQWKDFAIKEENPCIDGVYYLIDEENGTAAVAPEIFNSVYNYFDLEGDIVIPSVITVGGNAYQVTSVAPYAFANSRGVTSVTLPNSIREIGDYAFHNSWISGKMKLQEGLKTVGKYAFFGTNLSYIHLPYTLTEIGEKAFFTGYMVVRTERNEPLDIAGLNVFNHPEDVRCDLYVPYGAKAAYAAADEWKDFCHIYEMGAQIGGLYYELGESPYQYAWVMPESEDIDLNYKNLPADLVIPEKVTFNELEYPVMGINPRAFKGCTQLRTVQLMSNMSSINAEAFMGCTSLESINLKKGLMDIGERAFQDCALTSLDLPSSTDEIGVNAFKGCTKIEKIVERATEHPDISGREVFEDVDISQIELFVPYGAQDDYMYADVWQEFYTIDEYETEVTVVSEDDSKGTVTGSGVFEKGSTTEIEAEPAEGYVFAGWDDGQSNPFDAKRTITVGETPETFTASFEPRQLYIRFLDWDGTTLHTAKVAYGGSVDTEGFEPTRKGYSFAGWSMSPTNLTDDEEITAQYTINEYELTINADHGTVTAHTLAEDAVDVKAVPFGTIIVLDIKADENYHFKQWENGSETAYRIFTMEDNKTVTATFEHDPYTVTFKDAEGNTLKTEQVAPGGAATAPEAPEVEGYTFIGWDGFFNEVNADITVKAEYEIKTYNVTFKDWDGTLLFSQVVAWGTEADTPKKPYREGYTFKGWDKDYSSVKSDLVVTAQYEINKYTVTFFGNGGVELSKQTVDWNTAAVAPDAPAVEGYTFKGWDTDFSQVTKDLEVTAQYEINKFTVTFVDWDGTELSKQTIDWDGAAIYPSDPKREGYTFKGWDKAIDHVKADLTVTAQYEINTYTVTFYDREGKVISTQTVKWNEAAETPETPAWDGHTFTAWDTDFEHVKADLDIKPVYDTILYTVKFVDWNGNELKAEKVEYGQSATAPVNPVRDGYTFIGWDGFFNEVTADITVKAQYEINTYTVRFYDREDNIISTQTVKWNEAAKEPELEAWEGHLFKGWSAAFDHVKSNLDIKPVYEVRTYTVTFIGFDGKKLGEQAVYWNEAAGGITAPEVEGYTFTGWDKDFEHVTSDMIVTAQYQKDPATGIEDTQRDSNRGIKVIRNGVLYILRDGKTYNAQGATVK